MKFANKLIEGTIEANHSNLVIDIELESGDIVPVFCPNPDRVNKLYRKGNKVWVLPAANQNRKVKYDAVFVDDGKDLIMVDPHYIAEIFAEAFKTGKLADFEKYDHLEDLSSDGQTRLSFRLFNDDGSECYAYVCGIYNQENDYVVFPSFVDLREFIVYSELRKLREHDIDTYFVILLVRSGAKSLKFNWSLDPVAAAKAFDEARDGLKFISYSCNLDKNGIEISDKINIKL